MIPEILTNINTYLKKWRYEITPQELIPYLEEMEIIEQLSPHNNRYYMLLNHKKFFPIYISPNISSFGYTPTEIYNMSLWQAMKRIYWKQIDAPIKILQWGAKFEKITDFKLSKMHKSYYCGGKLLDKWGQVRTFFVRHKIVLLNKQGRPLLSFNEIEEITPFYKADFWWHRFVDANSVVKMVHFSNKKKPHSDLLSNRELEILQLIMQNKDNKTIGLMLNISPETIKKHRKNMIFRVGAKDMTSLIHICKLCELI